MDKRSTQSSELALAIERNGVCKKALSSAGELNSALISDNYKRKELLPPESEQEQAAQDLARYRERGIGAISLADRLYPPELRQIADPPLLLFYRGDISKISKFSGIAIVGARGADPQTCKLAADFATSFVKRGLCVVSGLALGVDGAAHRGALRANTGELPTIAVLGNGLSSVYPSSHRKLAEQILEADGLIISQFEPDERPYPANFLNRNRIISGLCCATVVIQAGERSGSLVTARNAAEEGREVFVVPGPCLDKRFFGSHRLIRDGATLVCSPEQVIEDLPEEVRAKMVQSREIQRTSSGILSVFEKGSLLHLEELRDQFPERQNLELELLELELAGEIEQIPGNLFQLI